MVFTKSELIASLQHSSHVIVHLAGKIEPSMLDYRPTPKQRSTIELLRYLSVMGPNMVRAVKTGGFNPALWTAEQEAAAKLSFDQVVAAITSQKETYASLLADMTDTDFRKEIEMFGRKSSVGAFLVNTVVGGYAAYRTQLFLYLKSCGREELNTMNLWAGMDPTMPSEGAPQSRS